jgi:vacuolar iron transporter family protein
VPHAVGTAGRLNWLRAGVLGANDGIVSVAGIVIGVAGATSPRGPIFTAGLAGLVAGAVSMALGEYVSVSSPMLAILLPPAALRVPVTFAAVLIALGLAGALSARIGGSNIRRAVLRVVIGGALGLAFTYGIGHLFGTAIG